ncbi:MAG: lycopene cyclase domain-containing protein [Actinobacteria bacterium]|nr:lycopene cyclase domain-containing protein [Actinomycetota bacterium]
MIAFIAICAMGVNFGFRLHILKSWRVLILTQVSILAIFLSWDYWAISSKHWYFDAKQILNFYVFPSVPIEEVLFFMVVPLVTILSYLSLLKLTGWNRKGEDF